MSYLFPLPDGRSIRVPSGTPISQAEEWARRDFPELYKEEAAPEKPKKEGFFANVKEGARNLIESSGVGIGAAMSPEQARALAERANARESDVKTVSWQDVKDAQGAGDTLGTFGAFARDTLGQAFPQIGATLAGAGAGGAAGSLAGPIGAAIGAGIGGIAANLPAAFGGNIQRQVQEAPGQDPNLAAAGAAAAGMSALDALPVLGLLGRMGVSKVAGEGIQQLLKQTPAEVEAKLLKSAQQSLLAATGKGAAIGAAVEMPAEVAQAVLERAQAGLPLTSPDALQEYEANAAGALVVGAPLGAAGRVSERSQGRDVQRAKEVEARQLEAQENLKKQQEEEARRRTPQYLLDLDTRYGEVQGQIKSVQEQIKALGKPATGTSEAEQRKMLERQRRELIDGNKELLQEHASKRAAIDAAKERARVEGMSPEEYMLESMGANAPSRAAAEPTTLEEGALTEREATRSPVEIQATEVAASVLTPYGGVAIPGTETDIVDALMQQPDLAAQTLEARVEFPFLSRQQNAAVRDALKMQLREREKLAGEMAKGREKAAKERTKEDVAEADLQRATREAEEILSLLATKPTTATGAISSPIQVRETEDGKTVARREAERAAALPGGEAPAIEIPEEQRAQLKTAKQAYDTKLAEYNAARAANSPTAAQLRNEVIDAREALDVVAGGVRSAIPQMAETLGGAEAADRTPQAPDNRFRELSNVEAELKEQDDLLKSYANKTLEKNGTVTEDGRKAALVQTRRDELVAERQQLLQDIERQSQRTPTRRPEISIESLIDEALAPVAGEEVTGTQQEIEQRVENLSKIREDLTTQLSTMLAQRQGRYLPRRLGPAIEAKKAELIAAIVAEIKAARSYAGLTPLSTPDAVLAKQVEKKIDDDFVAGQRRKGEDEPRTTAKQSGDDPQVRGLEERIAKTHAEYADLQDRQEMGEPVLIPMQRAERELARLEQEYRSLRLRTDPYFRRDQENRSVIDRQLNFIKGRLRELGVEVLGSKLFNIPETREDAGKRLVGAKGAYPKSEGERQGEVDRLLAARTNLMRRRNIGFGGAELSSVAQNVVDYYVTSAGQRQRPGKLTPKPGTARRISGQEGFTLGRQFPQQQPEERISPEDQALVQRMREEEIARINDAVTEGRVTGENAEKADRAIQQLLDRIAAPVTQQDVARAQEMFGPKRDTETPDLFREGLDQAMIAATQQEGAVAAETKAAKSEMGRALGGMKGKSSIKDAADRLAAKFGKTPTGEGNDYAKAKKRLDEARAKVQELNKRLEDATKEAQGSRSAKLGAVEAEAQAERRVQQRTLSVIQQRLKAAQQKPETPPAIKPIYKQFTDRIVALRRKIDDTLRPLLNAEAAAQPRAAVKQLSMSREALRNRLKNANARLDTLSGMTEEKFAEQREEVNKQIGDLLDDIAFYGRTISTDLAFLKSVEARDVPIKTAIADAQKEIAAIQEEMKNAGLVIGPINASLRAKGYAPEGVMPAIMKVEQTARRMAELEAAADEEADAPDTAASMAKFKQILAELKETKADYKTATKELAAALEKQGRNLSEGITARAQKVLDSANERQKKSDERYEQSQAALRARTGAGLPGIRRVAGKTQEILSAEQQRRAEEADRAEQRTRLQEEVEGKADRLAAEVARTTGAVEALEKAAKVNDNDAVQAELREARRAARVAYQAQQEFQGERRRPSGPATERQSPPGMRTGITEANEPTKRAEAEASRRRMSKERQEAMEKLEAARAQGKQDDARALQLRRKDALTDEDRAELHRIESRRASLEALNLKNLTKSEAAARRREAAKDEAADEKIEKAKTKIDAADWDSDVFFSRTRFPGRGQSIKQVVTSLEKALGEKGLIRGRVQVYETPDALMQELTELQGRIPDDVMGMVHRGKAYLFSRNIPEGKELSVLLHEVGAHVGFRNLLSKGQYKALANAVRFWLTKPADSQEGKIARAAMRRIDEANTPAAQIDDELIAYAVEEAVNAGITPEGVNKGPLQNWLRQIINALKKALDAFGISPTNLDAKQLVDMAYGAAMLELKGVYHGTGKDFDVFDLSKAGSGEGGSSFGFGTYVAQEKGVAKNYADIFDYPMMMRGVSYAPENSFLRWDLPLAEQSLEVTRAISAAKQQLSARERAALTGAMETNFDTEDGEAFYRALTVALMQRANKLTPKGASAKKVFVQAQKLASELLNKAGISGNKFPDYGSREGKKETQKTFNYVLFSDKPPVSMEIFSKNADTVGDSREPLFSRAKREYASSELGNAAKTMIGERTGTLAAIRNEATGLGFRTRFIDSNAALKAALDKGDATAAIQVSYDLMTFAQRNHFVQQAISTGAPTRTKWEMVNGKQTFKTEAQEGPNLKRVAELLSQVKGFGNAQATSDAFTLLALGLRARTRGWDTVFGDAETDSPAKKEEKAKARAEADKLADQYLADKANSPFAAAYKEYQDFNKSMFKFAMEAGVITEGEYRDALREGNYTPLFRKDKNDNLVLKLDSGRDITVGRLGDEAHLNKLKGGDTQVFDFFTASVRNASVLIDASLHNIASREAAFALQAMGAARKLGNKEKSKNAIEFRVKGREDLQRFEIDTDAFGIPTELVAKGFAGVPASLPNVVRLLGAPATFLRKAITRNPLYMARQLVRDPMSAWLTTGANFAPVSDTLKELGTALKGTDDKTLERRGLTGGMLFAEDDTDIERIAQTAGKMPGWSVGYVAAKLDDMSLATDAITRRNVYNAAIQQGASEIEATMAAYEAMPFSKRGTSPSLRYANHMIPFLSATVQGWDVLYRAAKGDMPLNERVDVRNKLLARGAMIAGITMLYALAMEDDEVYKNANTSERLSNWFLRVPGTEQTIKVPIPFELGIIFKMIPEALVRGAAEDKELSKELMNVGEATLGMIPNFIIPQAVIPIVETTLNKSFFTGNPIEGKQLESVDIGERYDKSTSQLSKLLGFDVDVFGTQMGISPKKLEYMASQYTAGLYPAFAAIIDTILPAPSAEKPDRKLAELPVFRSALQQEDAGGQVNRLYDRIERLTKYDATFKKLLKEDPAKAQVYAQENAEQIGKGAVARKAQAAIDKFNEMENIIRNNQSMNSAQKQKALENVKRLKTNLASQFSEILRT